MTDYYTDDLELVATVDDVEIASAGEVMTDEGRIDTSSDRYFLTPTWRTRAQEDMVIKVYRIREGADPVGEIRISNDE